MKSNYIFRTTLAAFFAMAVLFFLANTSQAQTCGDASTPGSESGQCRSSCDSATEHQISGTCLGQVCCASGGSGVNSGGKAGEATFGEYTSESLMEVAPCSGKVIGDACTMSDGRAGACGAVDAVTQSYGYSSGCYPGVSAAPSSGSGLQTTPAATPAGLPSSSSSASASGGGWSLGTISGFGLPSGTIWGIISNIMSWLLGILGIIGIIGFIISGILYLTSAGDDTRMETAKKAMQYSIIGVIIGLIGVVIIQAIDLALNTYSGF